MRTLLVLCCFLVLTGACRRLHRKAPSAPSPTVADVAALMDSVVRDFRAIVVLSVDEPEPGDPADTVAWLLHDREKENLAQLADHLTDPAGLRAFLSRLESDPGMRDADRLAFADVLAEVPDSPRVLDDRRVLAGIATRYDAEAKKTLGRFNTRGLRGMIDRREAWESYVAFVRGQLSRDDVMAEFKSDLDALNSGTRGGGWRDDKDQVTGRQFPEKSVLLTFDDGPSARLTPAVLDILQRYGVRAVFFEVGRNVGRAKAVTLKQEQAGHSLGNHTFTHPFLPKLAEDKLNAQLGDTNQALVAAAKEKPGLFRPPYGARNAQIAKAVSALGMKTVLWNIDSKDWADPVPQSIANRVLAQVERNKRGIILFHDIHARTVEALPLVLDELVRQKYTFLAWNGHDFEATHAGSGEAALAAGAPLAMAPLYRDSWAVVVGIDAYKNWPRLNYAVSDAKAVREILARKYGFAADHVVELYDQQATRENIVAALGDSLADGRKVARDDRVFVFYAGHGATRQLPSGKSQGYLIPVDADAKNFQSQAISMTSFQDISDAIPAKHVFFVMDACYSGLALTRGGAAAPTGDRSQFLQEITRRPAREVMTAGGADEQVADNGPNGHSIFTWTLLQGLEGKADLDGDGAITATELAAYASPAVSSLSRQTPVFGHMPGDQGGEFVFASRGEEEFLSEESKQLDTEAIKLNAELERVRKELEEKRARNQELRRELVAASAALGASRDAGADANAAATDGGATAPLPVALATQARREMERGMGLYREKRYQEAAQAFEAVLKFNPNHILAANNLGFTYVKMGRLGDAVSWYEKTLVLDPRRAVAWANLGDADASLGRTEQAKRAYQRFLELSPENKLAAAVRERLATLP